jgi:hypothetical protein
VRTSAALLQAVLNSVVLSPFSLQATPAMRAQYRLYDPQRMRATWRVEDGCASSHQLLTLVAMAGNMGHDASWRKLMSSTSPATTPTDHGLVIARHADRVVIWPQGTMDRHVNVRLVCSAESPKEHIPSGIL